MSREHFFYGALVGASAVALGCGAGLVMARLWCREQVGQFNQRTMKTPRLIHMYNNYVYIVGVEYLEDHE